MLDIIFGVVFALLLVTAVVEFYIIRGFIRTETSSVENKHLTGREIEEIRRRVSSVGLQAITVNDVFNLIMTIRDTHLGTYEDTDPYVPADPYEDVDER